MSDPKDYIVDNPINNNNFDSLIKSFNRESFVPFVGAGPSTILGAPNWEKLITNLCKAFKLKIQKKKFSNGKVDFPKTFSNLYKRINDKKLFYKKLFDITKPTQTELTGFHIRLVDLFYACITTNYDSPLELAFLNQHKKEPKKHFFTCYGISNFKDCIVYLHGHKDINFCIVKKEDYDYFYPSVNKTNGIPILEDFLSELFKNKIIIFTGFSFDDLYIKDFLRRLPKPEPSPNHHYWIISESNDAYREVSQQAKEYEKNGYLDEANAEISKFFQGEMNIKPIVYKSDYRLFSESLFVKLSKTKQTEMKRVEVSGIPVS